ncbi:MAG: peptidoglycan DD-metalloendopeptidase family protein, partial [Clostridia bacterium]|nr:peptidoglycan DD-metalloendopeptidase family protein [Clostridia bacterium]
FLILNHWFRKGTQPLQKQFENSRQFLKRHATALKITVFCIVGAAAVAFASVSAGITLGFQVRYNGRVIATVRSAAVFEEAKQMVLSQLESVHTDSAIAQPGYRLTLTAVSRLDSATRLAGVLLQNTDQFVYASALVVNGQTVVCAQSDRWQEALDQARTRYDLEGAENASVFADEVRVEDGYYLRTALCSWGEAQAAIDRLTVKTVAVQETDYETPFEKTTQKTAERLIGYSEITTKGQAGLNRKTETVEMINGVETARTVLSDVVVKEPVAQVKTVGTAIPASATQASTQTRENGFILPLSRGSFTVSAYFGDGRNHRAVDLATDAGSSIYAVADGTVVFSGYDGTYGNTVLIDHGNGLQTRYAHASALRVSQGQTVSQGEVIALVGRTGQATGNHLHFEVIVNGNRVNPAPYIGLR